MAVEKVMTQTVILELSDEIYTIIQKRAKIAGTSPSLWIARTLEQQYALAHLHREGEAKQIRTNLHSAKERFERHFGEVDCAEAVGADNEKIDEDLVREYSDSHEVS